MEEKVVCRNFRHTTQHGALEGKTQSKDVKYYNLDVIISVGYRVKNDSKVHVPSPSAIAFVSLCHRIRLLQPPQPSHSANAFVSFSHCIRLLQLSHSSPPVTAFDSFIYRIRLLQPPHSTPSANAAVSFCQLSRLLQLTQLSPSATAAVCVNSMK